jgi:hypothetical protein
MKKAWIAMVLLLGIMLVSGIACGQGEETVATPTPKLTPALTPSPTITPTPGGISQNFRLLISDDANAIEDFEHLYVNISRIGMHHVSATGNESGEWLEFAPEVDVVDLRLLVGESAQAIWSGNVTAGNYTKVFIYVSNVWGNLTDSYGNETIEVKLPSNKLHISKPFVVTDDSVTSFVYDIAVVATGNEDKGAKYILKPQVAQSGADQIFEEVAPE